MLALCMLYWVLNSMPDDPDEFTNLDVISMIISTATLGLQIFFGVKGNEMTAKNMLENGWMFADEEDQATNYARFKWSLV